MKVLFKISSQNKDGCETAETKIKKLEEYKKKLGKIISEKEVTNRRGKFIEIIYK